MPETVADQISYYTQKAGDLSRQLGLAGIAVIWLFKISSDQGNLTIQSPLLPEKLYLPLILIIASLTLDSIQYLIGIFGWGNYGGGVMATSKLVPIRVWLIGS